MAEQASMVVRITGNIDQLKKSLSDGKAVIDGVTTSVKTFGDTTGGSVHAQVQKFDNILSSLGINIGNDARAIGELSSASGKSAGELGNLATAGLAAGAALAGWKIGRVVSDMLDLDKTIGDATAKLLGWGDASAEIAANNMAVLAKASKMTGTEITSLDLATQLLSASAEANAKALQFNTDKVAIWNAQIAKVKGDGNWEKLTADLESQNFTLAELKDKYGITVEAIQFFQREQKKADDAVVESNKKKIDAMKESAAAQKEAAEKAEVLYEATTHLSFAQGDYQSILLATDPVLLTQIQRYTELGLSVQDMSTLLGVSVSKIELVTEAQSHQNDVLEEAHAKYQALEAEKRKQIALDDAQAAKALALAELQKKIMADFGKYPLPETTRQNYDLSKDEDRRQFMRDNPGARLDADAEYFKTHTIADAIAAGFLDLYDWWRHHPLGALVGQPMGPMTGQPGYNGYADGGTNLPGGYAFVGERGPELMHIPGGADIIPNHGLGKMIGGFTVVVPITINGSVLSSPQEIARIVGDAVLAQQRAIGQRFGIGT